MRVRNILGALAIGLACIAATGCMPQKVSPGEVGVLVSTVGSDKGVQMKPAKSGWNIVGFTENLYTFKTFDQNKDLGKVSFSDADGARLTATIGVTAYAEQDAAPKLFLKYRKDLDGIIETNMVQVLKTAFANEASKVKVDAIYGAGQEEFLTRVRERVHAHFAEHGLILTNLYLLDSLELPDTVREQLNKKVEANQITDRLKNEEAQAVAIAAKQFAEAKGDKDAAILRAEGQAEAIDIIGDAMRRNPQYIELKKVETWKGDVPQTLVTNGAANTLLPLK